MKVRDCMSQNVRTLSPQQTIRDAAQCMAECDVGAVPVAGGDRLIGMITDRDIAVRAVCKGMGPDTSIEQVMSPSIKYCFDDEDIEDVARNMGDIQLRRLPVMDRQKRLVGILSLGDIALGQNDYEAVGESLSGISRHGGQHSQAASH